MSSWAWALAWVSVAAGCEPEAPPRDVDAEGDVPVAVVEVVVPADHPCPDIAFTPSGAAAWDDEVVAPLALRLPTPVGEPVRVTQGNGGTFSHFGDERFAWDFGVPLDTPVFAAAAGVVVWMEDTRTSFGVGPEFRWEANFVVLDHGGGLFTSYVHLAAGSALVAPGDAVAAGEVLAKTGLSGQMTGPHLHFQVENVWSASVPARFATPLGCVHLPQQDETVVAWEVPLVPSEVLSPMPDDTFAEGQVVDVVGLPGRLFELSETPFVSGRTTLPGATEVWFLVLPERGGSALFAQGFPVVAGAFEGPLDLAEVVPGQYGVALVAGSGDAVSVPRSVRTALVH